MKVLLGKHELTYPSEDIGELRDCNDLLDDAASLHDQMDEDGYLLIRNFFDPEPIQKARRAILEFGRDEGQDVFLPETDLMDAVVNPEGRMGRTNGNRKVTHRPNVLAVLEHQSLFDFFERFFDRPARTFDNKWLRFVKTGGSAGPHYDNVYMGLGSDRLHTCWIPFGDYTPEDGTLAVLYGSHNLPSFENVRSKYGRSDVDRDQTPGHFNSDPVAITETFGGQWQTTHFQAGDLLILTMFTMHTSTKNRSDRWRISADIRFQPAEDLVDKRWVGEEAVTGNLRAQLRQGKNPGGPPETISAAKEKWGV
jgi:hypothetical protein